MELYMHTANVPPEQQALVAASNLTGQAALWFQSNAQGADLSQLDWPTLVNALREAFLPQDVAQRFMHAFLHTKQNA